MDVMIDLDKLSGDAASAVLDVIEEERRINKDDIREAIKKALKPHLLPQVPGGYGVGVYFVARSSFEGPDWLRPGAIVGVKENGDLYDCRNHPLLPDED
jgi:hypothetical protein